MNKDECPCNGCQDRNARCHMIGHCPHGYHAWAERNEIEREKKRKYLEKTKADLTAAQVRRHINFIKYGPQNTKR